MGSGHSARGLMRRGLVAPGAAAQRARRLGVFRRGREDDAEPDRGAEAGAPGICIAPVRSAEDGRRLGVA